MAASSSTGKCAMMKQAYHQCWMVRVRLPSGYRSVTPICRLVVCGFLRALWFVPPTDCEWFSQLMGSCLRVFRFNAPPTVSGLLLLIVSGLLPLLTVGGNFLSLRAVVSGYSGLLPLLTVSCLLLLIVSGLLPLLIVVVFF